MIKAHILCDKQHKATIQEENPHQSDIEFAFKGEKGDDGKGIVNAILNDDYTLSLLFTDGSVFTTPIPIRGKDGEKGDRGSGIADTIWNDNGTVTYVYEDGSAWTTPVSVKGEPGKDGEDGERGLRGVGIKSTHWNTNGTITYTYDDGTTFTTEYLKGEKGDAGGLSLEQQAQLDAATEKVAQLDAKVDTLELFKFPNANIVGSPLIEDGNISRFSASDYLVFPFVVDVKNNPFEITMCFTTGADVTTQQNILDSYFGMALAIQNGKGIMALSSNGIGWDIGLVVGSVSLLPNKTYYAKVSWDGSAYKTALSQDGVTYIDDMYAATSTGLYPTTMYIGASPNIFGAGSAHPFGGTINMNKCHLSVAGLEIWQGMDDAGLSTRADLSLSNLDTEGEKRFSDRYTKTEADNKFALKIELPTVPTNVSAFANDADYATETFVSEEFARQLALLDGNEVSY